MKQNKYLYKYFWFAFSYMNMCADLNEILVLILFSLDRHLESQLNECLRGFFCLVIGQQTCRRRKDSWRGICWQLYQWETPDRTWRCRCWWYHKIPPPIVFCGTVLPVREGWRVTHWVILYDYMYTVFILVFLIYEKNEICFNIDSLLMSRTR